MSRFVITTLIMALMISFAFISPANASYPPATKTDYGWKMPDGEDFIFLSQIDAREKMVSTERDGFLRKVTNLDMELRMQENLEPSEYNANFEKFKKFLKSNTRPWMSNEKTEIFSRLQLIYFAAKKEAPGFIPDKIYVIKTSGLEDIGDMYVRGECIVIPQKVLDEMTGKEGGEGYQYICRRSETRISRQDYLTHRLACMVFHVLRARNNAIETKLYSLIGFYPAASTEIESDFKNKIITNPTCWNNDFTSQLIDEQGKRTLISPICYSITSTFNTTYGTSLNDYMRMGLVEVKRGRKIGSFRINEDKNGEPLITMPSFFPDFYDNVSRNSQNLEHPATIMADNASLVVLLREWENKYKGFGSNLNHSLLDEIRKILSGSL